jgi:hypothetical protein
MLVSKSTRNGSRPRVAIRSGSANFEASAASAGNPNAARARPSRS